MALDYRPRIGAEPVVFDEVRKQQFIPLTAEFPCFETLQSFEDVRIEDVVENCAPELQFESPSRTQRIETAVTASASDTHSDCSAMWTALWQIRSSESLCVRFSKITHTLTRRNAGQHYVDQRFLSRDDMIRTCDLLLPKQAL